MAEEPKRLETEDEIIELQKGTIFALGSAGNFRNKLTRIYREGNTAFLAGTYVGRSGGMSRSIARALEVGFWLITPGTGGPATKPAADEPTPAA